LHGLSASNRSNQPPLCPPKTCCRRCIDRSDRQPVNSTNPARRRSCPTPWNEWSPAERFVSGSAPQGATRPFVDVQSVLCRTAFSPANVRYSNQPDTQQPAWQKENQTSA
jgi:hypothetical protein